MTTSSPLQDLKHQLHRVIVGQEHLLDCLLIALLCDGHVLLEGVPGLAKTKSLAALTQCIQGKMSRLQFTPDLLPSDLIGTEIYRPGSGEFVIRQGPIFANLVLADEINRAPAKVQSALLQAMQERCVTIGEQTFTLPRPFLVLATQNPIEQEGTYPLPEAQLDRFLMKVVLHYPTYEEEVQILKVNQTEELNLEPVITLEQLAAMREQARALFVDEKLDRYIVSLVQGTREGDKLGLPGMITWGASPRASLALRATAQAHAFLQGADHVSPADVKAVAPDVLRHRIILSFEADAKGLTVDDVIQTCLRTVAVP